MKSKKKPKKINSNKKHIGESKFMSKKVKGKLVRKKTYKGGLRFLGKQAIKQRKELFPSLSIGDANCNIGYKMELTDRNFFNKSKLESILKNHRILKKERGDFASFLKSNMINFCSKEQGLKSNIKMCVTIMRCLEEDDMAKLLFDLNRDKSKDRQINILMIKEKKIAFMLFLNNILIPIIKRYNKSEDRVKTNKKPYIQKVIEDTFSKVYGKSINIQLSLFDKIDDNLLEDLDKCIEKENYNVKKKYNVKRDIICDQEIGIECSEDSECKNKEFPYCDNNYCRKNLCAEIPKLKIEETELWNMLSDTDKIEKYYDEELFKNEPHENPLKSNESMSIDLETGKRCAIDDFRCQAISDKNKGSGTLVYIMFALLGFAAYFNTLPTTRITSQV